MKEATIIALASAGLTLCALIVLRHAARTAPSTPVVRNKTRPRGSRAQGRRRRKPLSLELLTAHLRREETRQRPWEARN